MDNQNRQNRWSKSILLILVTFTVSLAIVLGPGPARIAAAMYRSIVFGIAPAEPPYANVLLDMAPVKSPVKPYVEDGTTMVPLRALGEALGAEIGWDQRERAATYSKGNLSLIVKIGEPDIAASDGKEVPMPLPASLLEGNTMVPLRLFSEILGFQVSWDQNTRTVHVQSPKQPIELWGFYALGSATYSSWEDTFASKYPYSADDSPAQSMGGVFLGWFSVDKDGCVSSEPNPTGFQKPGGWQAVLLQAKLNRLQVFSMYFADQQSSNISGILEDSISREALAENIALTAWEYDGVLIDFEGLGLDPANADFDKENFNAFLSTLKSHLAGKPLSVALPPLNSSFSGYDHEYIGKTADFIVLMAYSYEDPAVPSPTAPFAKVEEAVKLEVQAVEPEKVILGIPAYGTLYKTTADGTSIQARPASRDSSNVLPQRVVPDSEQIPNPVFAPEYLSTYAEWSTQEGSYNAFLEDAQSLQARILMAKRYGIKGAAVWRLGLLPEDWWGHVSQKAAVQRPENPGEI